ncbi:uncharacterized protein [Cherax quadricarinatus]|uniref:uncharacterized protein n=1 Tax=Cherax quadricarinatus TaxID=27406 RepID=UPI00237986D1|nr:uncharacterized protein LOC128686433 [Cherax quadricarinatus]
MRVFTFWVATAQVCLSGSTLAQRNWAYFTAPGLTFNTSQANNISVVTTPDKCKSKCFTVSSCKAWTALQTTNNVWQCLTTSVGPSLNFPLTSNSSAVYGYFEDSLVGNVNAVQREDGRHYFIPSIQLCYAGAKAYCNSIPGFRLAIFRTALQVNISMILASANHTDKVIIDLLSYQTSPPSPPSKCPSGPYLPPGLTSNTLIWGDGTINPSTLTLPIDNPTDSHVLVHIEGKKYHLDNDDLMYFLCQY